MVTRHLPTVLATGAALVPWISLGGDAVTIRGFERPEAAYSLREQFAEPGTAALAIVSFLLIPVVLAVYSALRTPGPVWAGVAALCAGFGTVPATLATAIWGLWDGELPDGTPIGGMFTAVPTGWLIPLLASSFLMGLAALTVPNRPFPRWATQRAATMADHRALPAHNQQRFRALARVLVSLCGFLCLAAVLLPYRAGVADGVPTDLTFAVAQIMRPDIPGDPIGIVWGLSVLLLLVCAVLAPLPPRSVYAVVMIALTIPIAILNGLGLLFVVMSFGEYPDFHYVPGPAWHALAEASTVSLLAAGLSLRVAKSRKGPPPLPQHATPGTHVEKRSSEHMAGGEAH